MSSHKKPEELQSLASFLKHNLDPELVPVIQAIQMGCQEIARALGLGGLSGGLGSAGRANIHGETQQKLDVLANDVLKKALLECGAVRAIASEEEERIVVGEGSAPYLVAFDPLDGSSNIDINGQVGTIFSVLNAELHLPTYAVEQFYQKGSAQVCAGYVIYGPATQLVLAVNGAVNLFTLDRNLGKFRLTQSDLRIPFQTNDFSLNMSNFNLVGEAENKYVDELLQGPNGPRAKAYNMRWNGAMVSDIHRTLLQGGIFLYPTLYIDGAPSYKLRLLYEASPMALIIEYAAGKAVAELWPILDILPRSLHQKTPVVMGSIEEVERYLKS